MDNQWFVSLSTLCPQMSISRIRLFGVSIWRDWEKCSNVALCKVSIWRLWEKLGICGQTSLYQTPPYSN